MADWKLEQAFDYLDDLMTPQERIAFERDVEAGGPCADLLERAQGFRSLLAESRAETPDLDWEALLRTIEAEAKRPTFAWRSPWVWAPILATGIMALALLGPWMYGPVAPSAPLETSSEQLRSESKQAEQPPSPTWLTLADGSTFLPSDDAHWKLQHDTQTKIHIVLQSGSIRCRVTRNANRDAFQVEANSVLVQVLGTEFTVRLLENNTVQVAVDHGRVSVRSPAGEAILQDSESASFNSGTRQPGNTVVHNDPEPDLRPTPRLNDQRDESRHPSKAAHQNRPQEHTEAAQAIEGTDEHDRAAGNKTEETDYTTEVVRASGTTVVEVIPPAGGADAASETLETSKKDAVPNVEVIREKYSDPIAGELAEIILAIRKGQLHGSLRRVEQFQKKYPSHRNTKDALYLQGYCLYRLGNQVQALEIWNRYEALAPNGPWLRTVRDWTDPRLPDVKRLR